MKDPRISMGERQQHSLNVASEALKWEHCQTAEWGFNPARCRCLKCSPYDHPTPLEVAARATPTECSICESLKASGIE